MDIIALSDELDAALATITGLRTFPFYAEKVSPPAAVVNPPWTYEYDVAMGRGSDRLTIPITVILSRTDIRTATRQLNQYISGSGAMSVKAAVESYEYTSCDSVRVTAVDRIAYGELGGVEYIMGTFHVDVIGEGE